MIDISKLVLLSDPNYLDINDIEKVLGVDWYEVDYILMANCEEIDYLSETGPEEAGVDIEFKAKNIVKIDDCLKRWSYEDDFYHA